MENKPGIKHEHKAIDPNGQGSYPIHTVCTVTCLICLESRFSVCECVGNDPLTHICVAPKGESVKLVIRSGGVIIGDL